MADPIQFYFDFSSPYGYLASEVIDDLAARHGRAVDWRPYLIGAAFKESGGRPMVDSPLKRDYALRDIHRSARLLGVPITFPDPFPFPAIAASRAFYALRLEGRDDDAHLLAQALYRAAFQEGVSPVKPEQVATVASACGLDGEALQASMASPEVKARLREVVDGAIAASIFGSPWIVVDEEPFWGVDRLPQVERWLETGGW